MLFYHNADCTGTVEASGNNGCLDFTGLGANVQSYKLSKHAKRERNPSTSDQTWWQTEAQHYRDLLGLAVEEATGSLSPYWDPYAAVEGGFGHGNVTEVWGETFKWQQVALGVTIGIPIDEWDDDIHAPSDQFIVFGDGGYDALLAKRSTAVSLASNSQWNYAQCRSVLDCGRQFANSATVNIGNGWRQGVNAAYKLKTVGMTFYDWAHRHPFSVGIATTGGGTLTGYALGKTGGGATAQDNDQLAACTGETTQTESCYEAIAVVS